MTREEAIAYGKRVIDLGLNDETQAFCELAIKALEKEPTDDATLKDIFCMGCEYKEQEPCREADDYENEISDLHNRLDIVEYDKERLREEVTTLEEKLKGLSAEPCEDAISRQRVFKLIKEKCNPYGKPTIDFEEGKKLLKYIDDLPSVTPQPKTGHWIAIEDEEGNIVGHYCSKCDLPLETDDKTMYCPHCGCRMSEVWE